MSVYADLHVHTTTSDGTLALAELPAAARAAGVEVVAVTDHDRLHPDLDAPVVDRDGVTVVRGLELRAEADAEAVDLLGYGVDPTPALRRELRRLQADRVERGRAIVERAEAFLDVTLDVDVGEGIGRPHVARAIAAHPGTEHDVQDAFDEVIGADCPCYVARDLPDFETAVALLEDSCALVSLAHPLRYRDPAGALSLAAAHGVAGVERDYPYDGPVDPAPVERALREEAFVPTGGSDAHDAALGRAGLDREAFRRVAEFLPRSPLS